MLEFFMSATVKDIFSFFQERGMKAGFETNQHKTFLFLFQSENLPILIAHADTVLPSRLVWIDNDIAQGAGFDDRVGCWLLYRFLLRKPRCNFLITDLEETGGVGASDFSLFYISLKAPLLIELDFPGYKSFTDYGFPSEEANDFFRSAGFIYRQGIYSDCMTIASILDIPCINLSVGYYNPHSPQSLFSLPAFFATEHALAEFLTTFETKEG